MRAIRDLAAAQAADASGTPGLDAGRADAASEADGGAEDPRLANVVVPDEQGELRILAPWQSGQSATIRVEWSDTAYDLTVQGERASLVLPVSMGLRRKCEALRKASQSVLENGRNGQGDSALTSADTLKLPRFGICQTAGLGAWAIVLSDLGASGAGEARHLVAKLTLAHLDADGADVSAMLGTLEFAPGGLQMPPLMVYDYDDDGTDELIVRYDVTKVPAGTVPAAIPAVFSFKGGAIVPYEKLGSMGRGGVSTEQLEFDMRPDIADYGPYVAWLGDDCGAARCPERIVGPRFFAHSTRDGGFSRTDASALGALKRACSQAPASVLAVEGKSVNAARTAMLVGCAKAWGVGEQVIVKELEEKRALVCRSEGDCPLLATLRSWASQNPPARWEP